MATSDILRFRRKACIAIEKWMASQSPPASKKDLADLLGYDPSHITKCLGNGKQMANRKFLVRVAKAIPELSDLVAEYDRIDQNLPAARNTERAVLLRELAQLEAEMKAAVERVFDTIRALHQ